MIRHSSILRNQLDYSKKEQPFLADWWKHSSSCRNWGCIRCFWNEPEKVFSQKETQLNQSKNTVKWQLNPGDGSCKIQKIKGKKFCKKANWQKFDDSLFFLFIGWKWVRDYSEKSEVFLHHFLSSISDILQQSSMDQKVILQYLVFSCKMWVNHSILCGLRSLSSLTVMNYERRYWKHLIKIVFTGTIKSFIN